MNNAYIALGSNLKHPERLIRLATRHLRALPHSRLLSVAPLYKNPAVGRKAAPPFVNTVVHMQTRLNPCDMLKYLQDIEKKLGRVRKVPYGPRTMDCDLILYSDRQINTPDLVVPHPRYQERDFVLTPLEYCLNS